ncbi:hydantoinase/oxoprolinase family protein [Candidatus Poribacteria bacterium]|nr:hydantoinase/oxoprolinase family protein [Candidatus Poribacteria bacterium]
MNPTGKTYRLGIDIGGTFTDIVLIGSDGTVIGQKVPSTPDDYARGIVAGLLPLLPRAITQVVHGTTVATNSILERKVAQTGLITTHGFRDVLEIGRLRYPRLYDLTWSKLPPLVPRRLRREVDERIGARGEIVRPLDVEGAREVIRWMVAQQVESLAICLIHSYLNPIHEKQLGALCNELAPELPVSLSCLVQPEIKEYERTSTTVINATLQPVVSQYLQTVSEKVADTLQNSHLPFYVMQSNGGVMSAATAAEKPILMIESGPAAGVIGALTLAHRVGIANVLTLDMGGTTAKASLIEDGGVIRSPEYEVGGGVSVGTRLNRGGGYPLRVPAIDIAEVGAGGGSLVRVDGGGVLRVGPQSAGAVPGPACYPLGGEEPTLTDANVVLGYLNPDSLAGGALPLNAEKAHRVLYDKIAVPLTMTLPEVAFGAYRIAAANMARAARAVSVERGHDARAFVLCAFGGNGPLHAAELAQSLGMKRILIPPSPGLFSAFGLLFADIAHHVLRTVKRSLASLDVGHLLETFQEMEPEAQRELDAGREGEAPMVLQYAVDVRYVGQSFELTLPLDDAAVRGARVDGAQFVHTLGERFAVAHERTYGHRAPDDPIEVVNLRLTALIPTERPSISKLHPPAPRFQTQPQSRRCYFGSKSGWLLTPVIFRDLLLEQFQKGPLIIEEYDATILVPPYCTVARDEWGNVVIEIP